MSAFWQWASEHPILTFFAFWIACWTIAVIGQQPFRIVNRYFRHKNIKAHGWPKPPLDADGDVVKPEERS